MLSMSKRTYICSAQSRDHVVHSLDLEIAHYSCAILRLHNTLAYGGPGVHSDIASAAGPPMFCIVSAMFPQSFRTIFAPSPQCYRLEA